MKQQVFLFFNILDEYIQQEKKKKLKRQKSIKKMNSEKEKEKEPEQGQEKVTRRRSSKYAGLINKDFNQENEENEMKNDIIIEALKN